MMWRSVSELQQVPKPVEMTSEVFKWRDEVDRPGAVDYEIYFVQQHRQCPHIEPERRLVEVGFKKEDSFLSQRFVASTTESRRLSFLSIPRPIQAIDSAQPC